MQVKVQKCWRPPPNAGDLAYMYNTSKDIIIIFHNGSNYDYHFIIKEPAEESEGLFTWLGKENRKRR